jgi:hypothetical protein
MVEREDLTTEEIDFVMLSTVGGYHYDLATGKALCGNEQVEPPHLRDESIDRLLASGLIEPAEGGWSGLRSTNFRRTAAGQAVIEAVYEATRDED